MSFQTFQRRRVLVAEEKKSEMRWQSNWLYSQTPLLFWRAMAGRIAICLRATAVQWFFFNLSRTNRQCSYICVIEIVFSWKGKNSSSHTASNSTQYEWNIETAGCLPWSYNAIANSEWFIWRFYVVYIGWLLTASSQTCLPRIAMTFWSLNMAFDHKLWWKKIWLFRKDRSAIIYTSKSKGTIYPKMTLLSFTHSQV